MPAWTHSHNHPYRLHNKLMCFCPNFFNLHSFCRVTFSVLCFCFMYLSTCYLFKFHFNLNYKIECLLFRLYVQSKVNCGLEGYTHFELIEITLTILIELYTPHCPLRYSQWKHSNNTLSCVHSWFFYCNTRVCV